MTEIYIMSDLAPELICGDDSESIFPEYFQKNVHIEYYSELVDGYIENKIDIYDEIIQAA